MDKKVFDHVKKYCEAKGYGTDERSVIDTIRGSAYVWKGDVIICNTWIERTYVVNIDGMFIGFHDSKTTNKSYKFDKDSICEYEKFSEIVTRKIYKPKPETFETTGNVGINT